MLNLPATPRSGAEPAWLRRAAPSKDHLDSFLHSGAILAWSDDRWIIAWGAPEKRAHPDKSRPSFYAPDFLLADPAPWRVYPQAAAVSPDGLAQELAAAPSRRSWREFDTRAFADAFRRVEAAMKRDGAAKAVPAVFEHSEGPLNESERAMALRALANLPAGLMPYGWWDADGGCIGASPEVLFENDGVEIHTMAVAGTARAGCAPDEMMDDPKERAEHALVLEDLETQLAPFGRVIRGATRIWRIGILSHLRTDLRVSPEKAADFADLVRRLHPTPAVGVSPRRNWRDWVPRFDTEDRGRFAAPFGLLLPGDKARCLVAIRGIQWDREKTRCGAGCGIVEGSSLERETAELRLKLAATRGNLGF